MVLSIKSYIDYFINNGFISNVNIRELDNSEGVGLDLSLDSVYEIDSTLAMLGVNFRKTPDSKSIAFDKDNLIYLQPKRGYLLKTKEVFNLPENICCQFFPRSTLFRSNIVFQSSILSYGYKGAMVFYVYNNNPSAFAIEKGARFSSALFMEVSGEVNKYRGQWNNGRVSQPKTEKQV